MVRVTGKRPKSQIAEPGRPTFQKELGAFSLLFLLALALRLPFFFPAVLDWDESTYVLMGQSILDGHLPYIEQWDDKPPFAFVFYAIVIAIFGKDLVGIRLAGTLCVVLTAYFVYPIGRHLWNRRTGIIAAMLCVMAITLLPSGQSTITEHVALVPLVGSLSLLVSRPASSRTMFLVGILMATSSLVRLNLAYVALLVGFYALLGPPAHPARNAARRGLAYAGGGLLVVATTWVPYLLTGQPEVWWNSVILVPFKFANSQFSVLENLIGQTEHALGVYRYPGGIVIRQPWVGLLLWLEGAAGLAVALRQWRTAGDKVRRGSALVILFLIGTGFSILKSGTAFEHYMIQLVPFSALLAAVFYEKVLSSHLRWPFLSLVVILLAVAIGPIVSEYRFMVSRALTGKELRYGAPYYIAAYLKRENTLGRPVYMLKDHIVYWLIGQYPLTRWVHPSNIARRHMLDAIVGEGASTEYALNEVLRKEPEFIVTEDNLPYLRNDKGAKRLLEETLASEFILVGETEGRKVYRRK
jgi:4-amino-4-deoxy-L-arabinose transferase-like glycosyltransferase